MRYLTLLLIVGLLGFSACEKDEPTAGPNGTELLRVDGDNITSPILAAGFYEHAVKFPSSLTRLYDGDLLIGVQVHIYNIPDNLRVVIYGPGSTATTPGLAIYEGTVSDLTPNAVNDILFQVQDQIRIGASDLWIAIAYDTAASGNGDPLQVVGCDAGPKNINGDYLKDGATWTNFEDFSRGEAINWNIRGIVQPQ